MKKAVLLVIIAVISILQASAQEVDTTVVTSQNVSTDSLLVRLNKLQHDMDYMRCEYELYKLATDLKLLSHDISDSSNSLITYIYNERYDRALYQSYADRYDSNSAYFDALVKKVDSVKLLVLLKSLEDEFTETEIDVFNSSFEVIRMSIDVVENDLKHFDVALQTYKKKR